MEENKRKPIRFFIILIVVICLYLISRCGSSKAETEIHYGPEMNTPDPNTGIYDVIESDEPEPPYVPQFTWVPSPFETDNPDSPQAMPYNVNLKYDPFLAYVNASNGLVYFKRLNGTITSYLPPISQSILHQASAISSNNVDEDNSDIYIKYLNYTCAVGGISQSTTLHELGKASLVYVFAQDFSTSNGQYRIAPEDHLSISIDPHIKYLCSDPSLIFSPSAEIHMQITLKSTVNTTQYRKIYFDYAIPSMVNDGSDNFYVDIDMSQYAVSELEYVASYYMTIVINPIDGANNIQHVLPSRDEVLPEYYFTQSSDPTCLVSVWHQESEKSWITKLFNGIKDTISSIFVPNEGQIQDWIQANSTDELDVDNPLNMVKDIFVNVMGFFNGTSESRVYIDVPSLSFDVNGQKVTPFEGYTYELTSAQMTPVDGASRSLWYYVKLANSCVIATGLIDLLWIYFKKWYDTHYAGGAS